MRLISSEQPTFTPEPFLGPLFEQEVEPKIEAGYLYSPEETAMHGISRHGAIDFGLPRGTAVLAPADGWAVCTYGEVQLTQQGEPRLIGLPEATKHTPRELLSIPDLPGTSWPAWYGSFVVQIWHGQGRYTQLAHVDWVREDIPYFAPTVTEKGDLSHNQILRATVDELRQVGRFVKQGEVVAQVGMTGCGWGMRSFEFAEVAADGRPDFRSSHYWYWDQPHLHFMVFGARRGKARRPESVWDPFGLYSNDRQQYPMHCGQWPKVRHSLWRGS
jgi:murein DD-endopeptidase MepM/ murein hydrolase activator NlpD